MSISKYIDHTLLKVDTTREDIQRICMEAKHYETYSVCVNPLWVSTAHRLLVASNVKVCSVVGFPLGATFDSAVLSETELAIANGANEIDMVMNIGEFKSGNYKPVTLGIQSVAKLAHSINPDIIVKVIVESAVLTELEKKTAADIVANSDADFLKTSTGFVPNDHLLDDVKLFLQVLPAGFKVKAAGGIRSYKVAKELIDLGVSRIGASSTKLIIEEEKLALK